MTPRLDRARQNNTRTSLAFPAPRWNRNSNFWKPPACTEEEEEGVEEEVQEVEEEEEKQQDEGEVEMGGGQEVGLFLL